MCHGSLYDPYGHHIGFVNNFYTELGSVQMNLELEDGRTFQFNPGDLLRDRQGDWRIRKPEESVLDSIMTAASIKNVIFNPPATIVFWTDGSKTVVKCNAKEEFDPEKGMAMAIAKRCANNSDDFYKEIKKWVEKSGYKQVDDMKALVKEIKRVYYDPAKEPMDLCAKIVALKILIDGLDAIVNK